ncbi:hypothetical protein N3K66_008748 [Trichothecium roseum]|uniref:Uncharacterized protein n=1 Tax=Trichothecium roseum TaxID=47278 RepID=A0ACC0UR29_9HYPO|nr:hypothetical protein N3K66_008748 [Trichothecium roseum]
MSMPTELSKDTADEWRAKIEKAISMLDVPNKGERWKIAAPDVIQMTWDEWVKARDQNLTLMGACDRLEEAMRTFKQLREETGSADKTLLDDRDKHVTEQAKLRKEIEELGSQSDLLDTNNDILRSRVNDLEAAWGQSEETVASQVARIQSLDCDVHDRDGRISTLEEQVAEKERFARHLRNEASDIWDRFDAVQKERDASEARTSQLEAELGVKSAALDEAEKEAVTSRMQLDTNQSLLRSMGRLSSSLASQQELSDLLRASGAREVQLQKDKESLLAERDASRAREAQLQKENQSLLIERAASRAATSLTNQVEQALKHASNEATQAERARHLQEENRELADEAKKLKARIRQLEQAAVGAMDRAEENATSSSTEQQLRKDLEQAQARLEVATREEP